MTFHHRTVLLDEVVGVLKPGEGKVFVDGTLGGGGHTEALLRAGATVYGLDRDPAALAAAQARLTPFGARFHPVESNFADLESAVGAALPVDGVLLDLGVSSHQLDTAARGFSFQADGPLDMRMGQYGPTAADLIEQWSERELADCLWELGEERFSRQIARELKRQLPKTTGDAVEAVKRAVPRRAWPDQVHVATRTFQALRIAVNGELEALDRALELFPRVLKVGGVAAVISFHSLEDRRVKHAFRALTQPEPLPRGLPVLPEQQAPPFLAVTRKAVTASEAEVKANPRARSAKLRAVERAR